jgi:gamma-glutamylaminecyclotransferase
MKFFVYGTLKKGYGNHGYLLDSKPLGKAYSEERYTLYTCGFPLAYKNPDGLPIEGEIYEVDNLRVVDELDRLEGNGHFYKRHERTFWLKETEEPVTAWVYEIPDKKFYSGAVCKINKELRYEWTR